MGRRGPEPMPVLVRGVEYKDAPACAKALNVTLPHVYRMIEKGRADNIGLGRHNIPQPKRGNEITLAGKYFASHREVDRFLGKRRCFTAKAVAAGRLARLEKLVQEKLDAT